jgi:hypothetical protein
MGAAAIGVTEKEDEEQGIDEQDIFQVVLENSNKPYAAFGIGFAFALLPCVGDKFAGGLPAGCPWSAGVRRCLLRSSICRVRMGSSCTGHQI